MTKTIAPELDSNDSNYAHCTVETYIDMAPKDFFGWYINEPIENFMLGTLVVPPITGTKALDGPKWSKPGSARHITFKDGTSANERILTTNFPHGYTYQPWEFSNPVKMLSDHAKADMRVEADGKGTRVIWDYSFHARNKFTLQLLKLFVSLDWKRNLTNGLTVIKTHLEEHGTSKHIHEIIAQDKAA